MKDIPKPFLEHLEDLRVTIIRMGATLVIATILCFIFRRQILDILYMPLIWAGETPDKFLKVLGVVDPFMLALQIAFFAGFLFSLPLLFYFFGLFVLPALTADERKMIAPVFFGGTGLFVAGVLFCYYVLLPQALQFFLNFSVEMGFRAEWTVQNYIGFVVQMLAALGICFELPMVILILAKLGLVDAKMLSTHRRHALVAIVVLAAIITPTQDVFTLALMSGPMWLLYEGCVAICWWMERKERLREEQERAERQKAPLPAASVQSDTAPSTYPEGDPYEELMYGSDEYGADSGGGGGTGGETGEGDPVAGDPVEPNEVGPEAPVEGGGAGDESGVAETGDEEPEDRAEYPSPNEDEGPLDGQARGGPTA